eukprot:CAMPEP_0113468844 /NCGR_PEP_ID=MMETSP0014_2-20120614/15577_1 /TAXON_ID=2857 /ORGANISM="Nitzschia sp." /LENGTH=313 /DNA_ID=CAMNT_0000361271 /DNA_START=105 /DNA_END=1046 /DNA_ORIENTATION=+ /assembly_acc=CAM_ASM_000159
MTPPSTPRTTDNRPPPTLRVLFENDRVKVSDVRLTHRGDAILFSSQYPTVRWQVNDGVCIERRRRRRTRRLSRQQQQQPQEMSIEIKTASGENGEIPDEDGDEAGTEGKIIEIPDKTVFFENGGNGDACSNNNGKDLEEIRTESIQETTSLDQQRREKVVVDDNVEIEIENCGEDDYEFRQIWFEIKQSRPRRTEEETRTLLDNAIYSTDVGTTLLFENTYCRVWDFYYEPGGGDPSVAHHHVLDYVFVYVAKGRLLGYSHSGRPGLFDSINDDGDVSWFDIPDGAGRDPNYAHGGKNGYEDLPMREYLVELK